MNPEPDLEIMVVGASAGGVEALTTLVSGLPADLDAAVFVVLHTLATAKSLLPWILGRRTPMPVINAEDGTLIETGKIYIAPPDRHMLLHNSALRVVRGPKENRHRPSIDVLFRSAAMTYGDRVAGVLLSGADDDGTSGLMSIKRRAGVTVVQDPADSQYPDMPASAIRNVGPDYTLPVAEIGALLGKLAKGEVKRSRTDVMPEPVDKFFELEGDLPTDVRKLGTPSAFSCPECNGTLWELQDGDLLRYRCRVGHAYSEESMIEAEADAVDRALSSAVRVLEESVAMSRRIAKKTPILREEMNRKADEREGHARLIRKLLVDGGG